MKIKTSFLHFLKAAFGFMIINALSYQVLAQSTITISKPGFSVDYNRSGSTWNHVTNTTYTYNSNGDLIQALLTSPNNQPLEKANYTFDSFNNQRSQLVYEWINNGWSLFAGQKDSLEYNTANKIILRIKSHLQNGNWSKERFDYSYDVNGNQIGEIKSVLDNGSWILNLRTTFTYSNNILTEKLIEIHNGTTWQNASKEVYTAWHTPNILPTVRTFQQFDVSNNQWLSPVRFTTTLTNNGGYIELMESFFNNAWTNTRRHTNVHDLKGNFTSSLIENFTNGSWVLLTDNQTLLTYNSFSDITEKIVRYNNYPNTTVLDRYKYVYSNFQYFTRALGTSETQTTELALTVYPNPATDKIQIELGNKNPQGLTATISDLTGKTFLNKTFKVSETKQLNIEALPKGIYLLQLQTEAGSTVKRMVKQ